MYKTIFSIVLVVVICHQITAQGISSEMLEEHVTYLASDELLGRGFGSDERNISAKYIAEQFKEAGVKPLLDDYYHKFIQRHGIMNVKAVNVVGLIEGNDPELKNEYIILGAHYDHLGWKISEGDTVVYNGADDNASGTASIIEIGRSLVKNQENLKRSIILIAFDGEESGLYGSTRFVKDSIILPEQIKVMFSLDMVGMYDEHGGLDLKGLGSLKNGDQIAEMIQKELPLTIKKSGAGVPRSTDTAPFGDAGIPAIHAYTGTESPYHKPEDDSDLLDYDGMAEICDFLYAYTVELSNASEILALTEREVAAEKEKSKKLLIGFRFNSGSSLHNYKDDYFKAKALFSTGAGLLMQWRVNEYFSVQPEVLYEWHGSQHELGKFRMHSVTAPLSVMFTSPDPSGYGVRSYVLAGGYYSYHFGGTLDGDDIDFDAEYENQGFGLAFGAGMEVMSARIGFLYKTGLSGLLQDETAGKLRTEGYFFSFAIMF
ncbi:MAG: M28 family peptidase [Bacteroidales bacterium]|nr:M28 family peptidase [Bacteroidales bacterium]